MRVILLCAGYATRLHPLTKDQPKPLLPVGGRPILEWILERVKALENVRSVAIVSNHRFAGHFQKWADGVKYPWPINVIDDETTTNDNRLGAIGDLNFALKKQGIAEEDILMIAGDNLFTFDLAVFVRESRTKDPLPVIAVYDVGDLELAKQYGLVQMDGQGRVKQFFEKPKNPITTLASCGIYWLPAATRLLLDRYIASGHNPDQPGHYMRWLAETSGLAAVPLKGEWLDIGDTVSYEKANKQFCMK